MKTLRLSLAACIAFAILTPAHGADTKLFNADGSQSRVTLGGDVTAATNGTLTIGIGKVTNAMLAGSIAASKLVGTDITSVGTLTAGMASTGFTIAFGSVTMTGMVPVANGGTAIASYAIGDVLYASGTTTLSKLADVAAGSYLRSGGVTTAPVWSTTTLPNSATTGDLLYGSAANVYSNLADVATGQVLTSGGVGVAPAWSATPTISGANITSISASNISSGTLAFARLPTIYNRLTGDVPVSSSSTYVTIFSQAVTSGDVWHFEADLHAVGGAAGAGMKFRFHGVTATSVLMRSMGPTSGTTSYQSDIVTAIDTGTASFLTGSTTVGYVHIVVELVASQTGTASLDFVGTSSTTVNAKTNSSATWVKTN